MRSPHRKPEKTTKKTADEYRQQIRRLQRQGGKNFVFAAASQAVFTLLLLVSAISGEALEAEPRTELLVATVVFVARAVAIEWRIGKCRQALFTAAKREQMLLSTGVAVADE